MSKSNQVLLWPVLFFFFKWLMYFINDLVFFLNAREICIFHFDDAQGSTQIWQSLIWQKILFSQDQHTHKHRLCLGNPSSKPFQATTHLFLFTDIKRCSSPSTSRVINSDLLFAGSQSVLEATPSPFTQTLPPSLFKKTFNWMEKLAKIFLLIFSPQ